MKTFLFQGDSITDVGRSRDEGAQNLGHGYATMVAGMMHQRHPGEFRFLNRGISGNRSVDLYARIKKDVINLKPDYLSILIGVNDVWHEFGEQNGVSVEKYEKIYSMFIEEVKEALPEIKIFILEPFVIGDAVLEQYGMVFREKVEEIAAAAKRVAEKYNLPFIPLQAKFDEMAAKYGPTYMTKEGVHPVQAGHGLIATELMDTVEKYLS